jgi:hypothetical protein
VDKRLPPELLPELRARWTKYVGAREAVQAAAQTMQRIEGQYQDNLNLALRVLGLDPATNWKINLETGEVAEVTTADVVRANGGQPQGAVPWAAPTNDSPN